MNESQNALFAVLRAALRGESCAQNNSLALFRAASRQKLTPLIADAMRPEDGAEVAAAAQARELAVSQAQRTADFLLLLQELERRGLRPIVVKGLVCRSLYPKPELRYSADEDLLIAPKELAAYRTALAELGYRPESETDGEEDYELGFRNPEDPLFLELHTRLFPAGSEAYGDCARYFEDAAERAAEISFEGASIRTLAPTDHLLYLICHAYKHFLHTGIGVRQLCDLAMMAEKCGPEIDWTRIRAACDELRITRLTAAMFRICEKQLGFAMPPAFGEVDAEESALLEDILSDGRVVENDIDRAHSSTMTLEAVAAARSGRRRRGVLHTVFLPLKDMQGHFPYLKDRPWLLPAAWTQRVWRYLTRKKRPAPVNPARSVRIARERIRLLREYEIID